VRINDGSFRAHIIAEHGDPLNDIWVPERVVFVMQSGRILRPIAPADHD